MHVIINLPPVKGMPIRRALGASGVGSVPDEAGNPARLSVVGQIVVSFPFSIFSQAMSSPCMSPCRPGMSSFAVVLSVVVPIDVSRLFPAFVSSYDSLTEIFDRCLIATILHKACRFERVSPWSTVY